MWISVGQRVIELQAVKVGGTHSTSVERSKPHLLTQALFKSLEALLMYFISVQIILISIGSISKGAVFVGPICMPNCSVEGSAYLSMIFEETL